MTINKRTAFCDDDIFQQQVAESTIVSKMFSAQKDDDIASCKKEMMPFADCFALFLTTKGIKVIDKGIGCYGKSIDNREIVAYCAFVGDIQTFNKAMEYCINAGFQINDATAAQAFSYNDGSVNPDCIIGVDCASPYFIDTELVTKQQKCAALLSRSLMMYKKDLGIHVRCYKEDKLAIDYNEGKENTTLLIGFLLQRGYLIYQKVVGSCGDKGSIIVSCSSPAFSAIIRSGSNKGGQNV